MFSGSDNHAKSVCSLPQRYIISITTGMAAVLIYSQFLYTKKSILYMKTHSNRTASNVSNVICGIEVKPKALVQISDTHFNWKKEETQLIKNLYIYGYYLVQIPAGITSDLYGGKVVVELGLALASFLTLVTPPLLHLTHGSAKLNAALMFMKAVAAGAGYPAVFAILANWSPKNERCKMASVVLAASQVGYSLNYAITNVLITGTNNWGSIFYFFGALGMMWSLVWYFLGAARPSASHHIDEHELNYLKQRTERHVSVRKKIPLLSILLSLPLWSLYGLEVLHMSVFTGVIGGMQSLVRNFLVNDFFHLNLVMALMMGAMAFTTIICCWLSDFVVAHDYINITTTRKIFATFGIVGPIVFMLADTYLVCKVATSISMSGIALCLMSFAMVGVEINPIDLAPNFGGTLKGLLTTFDFISWKIVKILTTHFAPHNTQAEWRSVNWFLLWLTSAFTLFFMVFGSAEEQSWNLSQYKE